MKSPSLLRPIIRYVPRGLRVWLCAALPMVSGIPALATGEAPVVQVQALEEGRFHLDLGKPDGLDSSGLGLVILFEGSRLDFEGYSTVEKAALVAQTVSPQPDSKDLDGSDRTNRTLRLAWMAPAAPWNTGTLLARLTFRWREPAEALARITVLPLAGERFSPRVVEVDPVSGEVTELPPTGKETVVKALPAPVPYPRAITTVPEPCSPDIDGDGSLDALTDGVLALRYLLGFGGNDLVRNAIAPGATRRSGAQVRSFLSASDCRGMLDVDDNGREDALTDGILIVRYLFGFTGPDLVEGVIGANAARSSGEAVATWLGYYSSPRFVVAEGAADPGEFVADSFQDLRVRPMGDAAIRVRILEGRDDAGDPVFRFEISGGQAEIEFADPNRDAVAPAARSALEPSTKAWSGYDVDERWSEGRAIFLEGEALPGVNRLAGRFYDVQGDVSCIIKKTYELNGHCALRDTDCWEGRDPVLFVHGYVQSDLGGGSGTWEDFPQLLYDADFIPFEFRWNTSARFQDVAVELASSVRQISEATGRQVHLVAHSFGGVLLRTMLQRLLTSNSAGVNVGDLIASAVTLGTPHSGVTSDERAMHGVDFPTGRDTQGIVVDFIRFCEQLSCHQMGQDVFDATSASVFEVSDAPGRIAAEMYSSRANLPPLDLLALIGLTSGRGSSAVLDEGDGLITGWGQRFSPSSAVERRGSNLIRRWQALFDDQAFGQARVTERILGYENGAQPGTANPEPGNKGYFHSALLDWVFEGLAEPAVYRCGAMNACDAHASFVETLAWLEARPARAADSRPIVTLRLRAVDIFGSPVPGAALRLMQGTVLLDAAVTGANGTGTLRLPFEANSFYTIYVNAEGLRSAVQGIRTFSRTTETQTELGDLVLPPLEPGVGDLVGQVSDGLNGQPVSGAAYSLTRVDQVRPVRVGSTNSSGFFSAVDLVPGRYALRLSRNGYENLEAFIDVLPNLTNVLNVAMSPDLAATGTVRIILTWGENPRDLDSHLLKYRSSGSLEYHIFYADRAGTGGDFLDRDDVTSFGPETVTIQRLDPSARYVYSIHHFSGSGSLPTTSQARVTIVLGDGSQRTFNVPRSGSGRWWKVFEINGSAIEPCTSGCIVDTTPSLAGLPPWLEDVSQDQVAK